MPKVLLFMRKKPGMSDEAFRRHYETFHAKMAEKYLGKYMTDYRRNFIVREDRSPSLKPVTDGDFDVVTEIWYKDQPSLDAMWAKALAPEVATEMDGDAENFLDPAPGALRVYVVDEYLRNP